MTREKSTPASVTTEECTCGYQERQSEEANIPIVFDAEVNEFHIAHPDGGQSVIYHCPWCGGAAPRSQRDRLFAKVTMAESARLDGLTGTIRSIEEAIATFGPAQRDEAQGLIVEKPATDSQPPATSVYRTLTFTQLSDTADVVLIDYGPAGVRFTFQGKYLGRPSQE
jgi:uncharacterized protein DUF6980